MARDSYTRYPRPLLWLVHGGTIAIGGPEVDAQPRFAAAVEPFYIGKFPVTNEQFEAFDPGFERSPLSAGDRDPAAGVRYSAAAAYCEWYAGVSRKPMRLPTEVEWEYACRSGSPERYFSGADPLAAEAHVWHRGNSPDRMPELDGKQANDFGLYGMLGGVWEWTSSRFRAYPLAEPYGGKGAVPGARVLRGGSVRLGLDEISCSLRRAAHPGERPGDAGFRIVKSFR